MTKARQLVIATVAFTLLSASVAGLRSQALGQIVQDTFDISYGDTVSDGVPEPGAGNIEVGRSVDSYTFDANAGDLAIFDTLAASATFRWSLETPGGDVLFDVLYVDRSEELPETGTYVLTVFGSTATTTGTYSFHLLLAPPPRTSTSPLATLSPTGCPSRERATSRSPVRSTDITSRPPPDRAW